MIKAICCLLAIAPTVTSQNTFIDTPSPCPNVFRYDSAKAGETPGPGSEKWYGVVTLNTDITLHALWLNIILDSKADFLGNWVGEVTTEDNINFKIENTKTKLVPNTPATVRFFIQYKEGTKKPNLHTILFNGREICNAANLNKPDFETTTLRSTTVATTKIHQRTKSPYQQVTTAVPKWTQKVPIQQATTQNPSRFGTTSTDKASLTVNAWGTQTKVDNQKVTPVSQTTKYDTPITTKNNSETQRIPENQSTVTNDIIAQIFLKPDTQSGSERQKNKTESQLFQKVDHNNRNSQTDQNRVQNFQGTTETNKIHVWSPATHEENQPPRFKQPVYIETTTEKKPVIITGNSNYYIESNGQIYQPVSSNKDGNNQRYEIVESVPTSTEAKYPWAQILSEQGSEPDNSRYGVEDSGSNNRNGPSAITYQMNNPGEREDYVTPNHQGQQESEYFTGGIPTLDIFYQRPQDTCGRVTKRPPTYLRPGSTTSEGQWPWQAAIYRQQTVDFKYICGATLVSQQHVVTAAHCVAKKNSRREVHKNTLTIYLGKFNLRTSIDGVQIRFVNKITIHPDYNPMTFDRDLAILQLREIVSYTDWVRPACLWPNNLISLHHVIGEKGSVVGWGSEVPGISKEELSLLEMPVVSQETCINSFSEFYDKYTSDYTYCAGYNDANSVCKGDSGGGMVFKRGNTWYLRGLVTLSVARSNEYRCDPSHYVVFTDIAKFLLWIQENIN